MIAPHESITDALPEFSRIVAADDIDAKETTIAIEAKPDERAALANRFDLIAIDSLSARLILSRCLARDGSGMVLNVTFDINADVVQRCVVSLEPVAAKVNEVDLVVEYRLSGEPEPVAEVEFALEAVDPPEILVDDRVDLGELVAEHLALALDPYPRAEGAAPESTDPPSDSEKAAETEHPFGVLRGWQRGAKSD